MLPSLIQLYFIRLFDPLLFKDQKLKHDTNTKTIFVLFFLYLLICLRKTIMKLKCNVIKDGTCGLKKHNMKHINKKKHFSKMYLPKFKLFYYVCVTKNLQLKAFLDLNIYETIKKEKLNWKILICFFCFLD